MTQHNGFILPRNFVRVPNDTYASYIIMFNSTVFRYLKNQTDKQREAFIKKFPALTEWNHEAFYYWYREVERLCYTYYMFVLPYYCAYQSCPHRQGFEIGNPLVDHNVDLHVDYTDIIPVFSQQLFQALSRDGILPTQESRDMLAASDGCGYACLYSFHCILNPILMIKSEALELVSRHPSQNGISFYAYCRTVDFYHQMAGLLLDLDVDINSETEQTIFVQGLDRGDEIKDEILEALESNNKKKKIDTRDINFKI